MKPKIICSCGRPLIDIYSKGGKKIGVTHSIEDEDWHIRYWSNSKLQEKIKSN